MHAERLARDGRYRGRLSIDALRGSTRPFDPRIHRARGFAGQQVSAANLRALLAGERHQRVTCQLRPRAGRLFDALRGRRCTAPRAKRSRLRATHFGVEANAATDNPMVFDDAREIVSGGNFHGAPVGLASDVVCLAPGPAGHDQRAALRTARQSGAQRSSAVPYASTADCNRG